MADFPAQRQCDSEGRHGLPRAGPLTRATRATRVRAAAVQAGIRAITTAMGVGITVAGPTTGAMDSDLRTDISAGPGTPSSGTVLAFTATATRITTTTPRLTPITTDRSRPIRRTEIQCRLTPDTPGRQRLTTTARTRDIPRATATDPNTV